jgi:hypothetical protein
MLSRSQPDFEVEMPKNLNLFLKHSCHPKRKRRESITQLRTIDLLARSSIMTRGFEYEALPDGHIRLLTVSTHWWYGVHYTMKSYPLEEAPSFCALSYVWGAGSANKSVKCNDQYMNLTPNLYGALNSMYRNWAALNTVIWIDAVCINQQDDEEKGRQVAMMDQIYKTATVVIVWLGPSEDYSDLVADSLDTLVDMLPGIKTRLGGLPLLHPLLPRVSAIYTGAHGSNVSGHCKKLSLPGILSWPAGRN